MTAAGLTQYTIEEMRAAIGEQELINGVNTELANLQKENTKSLVSPEAPSLKVNSMEELMQKIKSGAVSLDTNFQAQRDGASAGPLAQEIKTTGDMLTAETRANIEADPNYQSSRKSFEGLTENGLNQILDDTIPSTVAQKAAAQDLKEELLLDRISKVLIQQEMTGRQLKEKVVLT